MKYYKKEENGNILTALEIFGPGWKLDQTTVGESHDGWIGFETDEEAYEYFAQNPDNLKVTSRQIRLALLQSNISMDLISEALSGNPGPVIEWEYSQYIERSHPLVSQVGQMLGLSEDEINNLFQLALTF